MNPEPVRCTRCVLPAHFPRMDFDAQGVCGYCRAYEERWKNWDAAAAEAQFWKLVEAAKKRRAHYDVLCAFSGGKDSSYVLHLLVQKFGLKVLAFTYDNGFFPAEGKALIASLTRQLQVEHRYVVPDQGLNRRMYRALLKKHCADFCQICMIGTMAAANQVARAEKIPMVVWGFSPRTEAATPLDFFLANDYRYLVDVVEPEVNRFELSAFHAASLTGLLSTMFLQRVRHVLLPLYVDWNEKQIAELLQLQYSWKDYGGGNPHFDCVANQAVDYFTYRRWGVSKVAAKLAQLVRSGQLTRDEALAKLREKEQVTEPVEYVNEVCQRLQISREEIRPYLEGQTLNYRHFKSYSQTIEKFAPLLRLPYKLGVIDEATYRKYSWKQSKGAAAR